MAFGVSLGIAFLLCAYLLFFAEQEGAAALLLVLAVGLVVVLAVQRAGRPVAWALGLTMVIPVVAAAGFLVFVMPGDA